MILFSKIISFIMKYWPIIVVVSAICYFVWLFTSMSGEIKTLESDITSLLVMNEMCQQSNRDWARDNKRQREAIEVMKEMEESYLTRLRELESAPPAVIYRYRDRVVEVPNEITADTCEAAIVEMASVLKGARDGN